jgi:uncharacterized alkaline shock family protein YloU
LEVNAVPTDARVADRLPCGVPVDDLLSQVADSTAPRDPEHQRTCRHCRATLAELTALWGPMHDLARQDVRAPEKLLDTVMARVRELPRSTWHAILPSDHDGEGGGGQTRVAARVVAAVARLAAQSVPHVTLAVGGGRTTHPSGTDVAVAGSHVVIDVQLVVDHGTRIHEIARQVRAQITRHITAHTGLTAAEVNINITDVRLPPP